MRKMGRTLERNRPFLQRGMANAALVFPSSRRLRYVYTRTQVYSLTKKAPPTPPPLFFLLHTFNFSFSSQRFLRMKLITSLLLDRDQKFFHYA